MEYFQNLRETEEVPILLKTGWHMENNLLKDRVQNSIIPLPDSGTRFALRNVITQELKTPRNPIRLDSKWLFTISPMGLISHSRQKPSAPQPRPYGN